MIGALIIVFREVLEAALVIGIVGAAVKGVPRRGVLIGTGVAIGVIVAALVASGIDVVSGFAHGTGQALFEAGVLTVAGLMLAWHNLWVAEHGREMAARLKTLGTAVTAGQEPATMLVVVTALAVMREGSEVSLFLYGIAASGVNDMQVLIGGLLGVAAGVTVGYTLFAGLSRIPIKSLFRVSGVIILFIASGMLSRGAAFLVQAGYLPPLIPGVWNTSWLVPGGSVFGRSLEALVGYTPAPSLMQVLVWIGALTIIGVPMLVKSGRLRLPAAGAVMLAIMTLVLIVGVFVGAQAYAADYKVYSPTVVKGETELEMRAFNSWGAGPLSGARQAVKFAAGHTFTHWWATEVYAEAEKEPSESLKLEDFEWENRFQLTPQGKYWADVGLINENEIPRYANDPYRISIGPSLAKDFGRISARLNLLVAHEYGTHARHGIELDYRARIQYRWRRELSPIVEAYGEPVGWTGLYGPSRQQLGMGLVGQFTTEPGKDLRYGLVALYGTTTAASRETLVARLEYEFF
ncbi:hypothetical protein BJI67_11975 [Acidihalobacter aeolianus]|uniref:Iron permease n=1 Tax=Acidihalobacter aeolianus TaxID=2792603 RepID=A0A1D8K9P7_9GAMM|nr:FTR1 family protein [Acidihalobacter aeolianus]AOV17680.1 hypothetical protein BJI67_11975 [Acidihalobacter aeolianus]